MLHPITIRILRRDETKQAPECDDRITITKLTENRLKVVYTEKSEPDVHVDVSYMGYQQALIYLSRVLYMLTIDNDPFLSVQFLFPGYPITLLQIPNLKDRIPMIIETFWTTCMAWPSARNMEEE